MTGDGAKGFVQRKKTAQDPDDSVDEKAPHCADIWFCDFLPIRITDRLATAGSILVVQSAVSAALPAFSLPLSQPAPPLTKNERVSSTMNSAATNSGDKSSSMSSSISSEVSSPKIPPIRSFRKSRTSTSEMLGAATHRHATDEDDNTLRAPENNTGALSDDSDLFLNIAKEEANLSRHNSQRLSRVSLPTQRSSLPPPKTSYQPIIMARRRGSDQDARTGSRSLDEQGMERVLTYKPRDRDRPPTNRYFAKNDNGGGGGSSNHHRSAPTTPRTGTNREISPPESLLTSVSRRPSVPDSTLLPPRSSYRQSTLAYTNSRSYNSSPLVARTPDTHEGQGQEQQQQQARAMEGTESTVSTAAPSTVWDELEDLKSRIHRLELTGKLPDSSGAAVQHASGERPPTATTTVTTVSLSPKRARGNSLSPTEVLAPPSSGTHPLLRSALEKSKPLLSPEVYKALEATSFDALAISSMMGSPGQPGPISSSQSVVGGGPIAAVSDRQVRRKADSMCRSLTELCLALSESKTEQEEPTTNGNTTPQNNTQAEAPPIPRIVDNIPRPPISNDLARMKLSPRPLSRLEARRSSLLATSSLPAPRYNPSEATTPTQAALAHRRASLMFRTRRTATEEPAEGRQEDEDETRFRAPSRATTDLGRVRNGQKEYPSLQPLVTDNRPSPTSQSSLPVRRHYVSTNLNKNSATSPSVANHGSRRYYDRGVTPEKEPGNTSLAAPSNNVNGTGNSPNGRLAVNEAGERVQRKPSSSMSQAVTAGASNLARRTRQTSSMDAALERQTASTQQ
ncbi:hypothetical protein B7463_g628, partial [Scytalidium lignicola]